jgi:hypothetical protein
MRAELVADNANNLETKSIFFQAFVSISIFSAMGPEAAEGSVGKGTDLWAMMMPPALRAADSSPW